jgi:hypothetical protein
LSHVKNNPKNENKCYEKFTQKIWCEKDREKRESPIHRKQNINIAENVRATLNSKKGGGRVNTVAINALLLI